MNAEINSSTRFINGKSGHNRSAGRVRSVAIAIVSASLAMFAASGAYAQGHGGGHGGGGHFAGGGGHFHGGPGWSHGGYWRGGYRGGWGGWGGVGLGIGIGLGVPAYYYGGYGGYPYDPGYVIGDPTVVYSTSQPVPLVDQSVPQPVQQQSRPAPVIYPRNGQSAAQITSDSDACSQWAGKQPNATTDPSVFGRSVEACMDAHGYTLR
jgi:hypothetical protein